MQQQTMTANKKCKNIRRGLIYNPMQYNQRIRKDTKGSLKKDFLPSTPEI